MLIAAGHGVVGLQSYSSAHHLDHTSMTARQGDPLDKFQTLLQDPFSSFTIDTEDDLVVLDETDPTGWPTVQLLSNPSFEGTYSGSPAVAPNWIWNSTGATTGQTGGSSATAMFGASAQQLQWSNAVNGVSFGVYQVVKLPTDENLNPITTLPYFGSVWTLQLAKPTGTSQVYVGLQYWSGTNGTGTNLGNFSGTFDIGGNWVGVWKRWSVSGTPPAGSQSVSFVVYAVANNATNSGSLLLDGAQLEYATFATYQSSVFNPQLANIGMAYHGPYPTVASPPLSGTTTYPPVAISLSPDAGAGFEQFTASGTGANAEGLGLRESGTGQDSIAPGSLTMPDNAVGAEFFQAGRPFAVVDGWFASALINPAMAFDCGTLGGRNVQYVTLTNAQCPVGQELYTRGIAQDKVPWNPNATYTLTMTYQVTQALSPLAQVSVGMNYEDANGNTLAADTADALSPPGQGVSLGWQTISIRIGPQTHFRAPAGTRLFKLFAGIVCNTSSAPTSGEVAIDSISLIPDPIALQTYQSPQTALLAGMYPTPYCDAGQPGCFSDTTISGTWVFRQLRLFGGFVKVCEPDYGAAGGQGSVINIEASDYGVAFAEAPANLIISPQQDYGAIQQAVVYAQSQGHLVGFDTSTFVAKIGIVSGLVINWLTTRDVLDKVCNQMVASWWVDPYKRLHYQPALAVSAPYALSDTPDYRTSFPYSGFKYRKDANQSATTVVIEGDMQLSAPQTITFPGATATMQGAGLTNGTQYSSITIDPMSVTIPDGTQIVLSPGGSPTQAITVSNSGQPINATNPTNGSGGVVIPVVQFTANGTYAAGTSVAVATTFTVNHAVVATATGSLSAPAGTTLTAGLTSGTHYTSLSVASVPFALFSGATILISTGANEVVAYTTSTVAQGATSIPIQQITPAVTIANGASVRCANVYTQLATTALQQSVPLNALIAIGTPASYQWCTCSQQANPGDTAINIYPFIPSANIPNNTAFNLSGPIAQIDSLTVSGTGPGTGQQVVGLSNINQFSQGFGALYDPTSAQIQLLVGEGAGQTVTVVYRFNTPVLVRLRAPKEEDPFSGKVRRKIHLHISVQEIKTQQAAIDRADAELTQRSRAKPIGKAIVTSPTWPQSVPIQPGTAIKITSGPAKLSGQLFQIQQVVTKPTGNGAYRYELDLGYYTPDFALQLAASQRGGGWVSTDVIPGTVLQDVLSMSDGWTVADSITAAATSPNYWAPPVVGYWSGSFIWN